MKIQAFPAKRRPSVSRSIKDLNGNEVFVGTDTQWREWVKDRRQRGELWTPRAKAKGSRKIEPKFCRAVVPAR